MLVPDWLKLALECGCCAGVIGVIGLFSFMLQRLNKISKNILFPINSVSLDFHRFEIFLFIFLLRAAVILGRCAKSLYFNRKMKIQGTDFSFSSSSFNFFQGILYYCVLQKALILQGWWRTLSCV